MCICTTDWCLLLSKSYFPALVHGVDFKLQQVSFSNPGYSPVFYLDMAVGRRKQLMEVENSYSDVQRVALVSRSATYWPYALEPVS